MYLTSDMYATFARDPPVEIHIDKCTIDKIQAKIEKLKGERSSFSHFLHSCSKNLSKRSRTVYHLTFDKRVTFDKLYRTYQYPLQIS